MRLINADELLDSLRDNTQIDMTSELEQAIENQSIICNVDKVVAQLLWSIKEVCEESECNYNCRNCKNEHIMNGVLNLVKSLIKESDKLEV